MSNCRFYTTCFFVVVVGVVVVVVVGGGGGGVFDSKESFCLLVLAEYPPKWLQSCLVVTMLVPREKSAGSPCITIHQFSVSFPVVSHIMQVCLAVTCVLPALLAL